MVSWSAGGGVELVHCVDAWDARQAWSSESAWAKAGIQVGTVTATMSSFFTGSGCLSANVGVPPKYFSRLKTWLCATSR